MPTPPFFIPGVGILGKTGRAIPSVFTYVTAEASSDSPLDRAKAAILELPDKERQKLYEFLYGLGHRMF